MKTTNKFSNVGVGDNVEGVGGGNLKGLILQEWGGGQCE